MELPKGRNPQSDEEKARRRRRAEKAKRKILEASDRLGKALQKSIAGLESERYTEEDTEIIEDEESTDDQSTTDIEDYSEDDEEDDNRNDLDREDLEPKEDEEEKDKDENPDDRRRDDKKKDEEDKQTEKEQPDGEQPKEPEVEPKAEPGSEPATTRQELPKPESPIKEPPTGGPSGGATSATETAGAGATGTGAGTAAVETTAAGTAAGGATVVEGGAAAGTAAVVVTSPEWGTAAIIIGGVLLVLLLIIGIVIGAISSLTGGREGSTPSVAVDANDPATANTIAQLAALAGDEDARRAIATQEINNLDSLLTQAETDANGAHYEQEIVNAINLARQNAEAIRVGRTAGTGGDNLDTNINNLFKSLDQVVGLYYGVNINSRQDIADRAIRTIDENLTWVFTTNVDRDDATKPLFDGSNEKDGKRGCSAAGFGTIVLRRDPTDITKQTCKTCLSPGYNTFVSHYKYVLASQPASTQADINDYAPGDILLTEKKVGEDTYEDLFVVLGDRDNNDVPEVANCSESAPFGPQQKSINFIPENQETITQVLRYKYGS